MCLSLQGEGHIIADCLTVGKDGEADRATPDQIAPSRSTPIPDRDYIHPDLFVRGHKEGFYTRVPDEKTNKLRKLSKDE